MDASGLAAPVAVNVCSNALETRSSKPSPAISEPTGTSTVPIVERVVYEPSVGLTAVTAVAIETTTSNRPCAVAVEMCVDTWTG